MKKQTISSMKKKADKYFSLYIRYRDSEMVGGQRLATCITCGVKKPVKEMQNGHFVSRVCSRLRYSDLNCSAQCMPCNVMRHGDLYEYARQLDLKFGDGTAESLHNQRHENHKLTITELEQIISDAKEYVKDMEG